MILYRRLLLSLVGLALAIGATAACRPIKAERKMQTTEPETAWMALAEPSPTTWPLPGAKVPSHPRPLATPDPAVPARPSKGTPVWLPIEDPVDLARADLARRLGIETSQIVIVHIQADEFPASNLGCPGKTTQPMPALVSGIEIVLAEGDHQHVYRARKRTIVYCGPRPQMHKSPRP